MQIQIMDVFVFLQKYIWETNIFKKISINFSMLKFTKYLKIKLFKIHHQVLISAFHFNYLAQRSKCNANNSECNICHNLS